MEQKLRNLQEKKGLSLPEILGGFMIVGSVVLLVIMIAFVFESINTNIAKDTGITINESGRMNATAYTVNNRTISGFESMSVTLITNNSGFVINAANYSFSASAGTVTGDAGTGDLNLSSALISYTYLYDGPDRQVANRSIIGVIAAMPIVLIILVVLAIGAIITILFRSIVMRDNRA